MEIYDLNNKFDFNNITLDNPYSIQGGSFFTKILFKDKPLCFQLPKCSTKQGLVETKKYKYFDLLYNNQENLIHWIENFENTCVEKINEKKNLWFSSEIDKDDIENLISPMLRIYSSGKKFILKTYIDVDKSTKNFKCNVYNENEEVLELAKINNNNMLIPLVLIEGIKFSSKNFEIIVKLNQIMILNNETPLINKCLIKNSFNLEINDNNQEFQKEETINKEEDNVNQEGIEKYLKDDNKDNLQEIEENDTDNLQETKEEDLKNNHTDNSQEIEEDLKNNDTDNLQEIEENLKNNDTDNLQETKEEDLEKSIDLEEVNIEIPDGDPLILTKPESVYYNLYKNAMFRAKQSRKEAIKLFLEAKNIKTTHMLNDIDDSEEEEEFYNNLNLA